MKKIERSDNESQSHNIIEQNIQLLKGIFPEVYKDGTIDITILNDLIGNYGDIPNESYNLNWAGKTNARREAQKRSTGTLRPCPEESVDWDNTENVYIEGDNLEVLKLLQKSYHDSIKMIYIDPPYNTGKDFVYKDNYKDNIKNYLELTSQDKSLTTNTESDGRYHSNWLNMMYPRLKLAQNLLSDDGVIFISIDDNEVDNLRKICNEIYGEDNFVAELIWRKKAGGANDSTDIAVEHEYILCYKKENNGIFKIPLNEERIKDYKYSDEKVDIHGKYLIKNLNDKSLQDSKGLHYDIVCPDGTILKGDDYQWKCNEQTFNDRLNDNRIVFIQKKDGQWTCNYKIYLNEEKGELKYDKSGNVIRKGRNLSSIIDSVLNKDGSDELKRIFNNTLFSYPKPTKLIKILLQCSTRDDAIILDFFSGSATTADAVMQLNAEDGGNRKYICVQIPEPTPEDSEARNAGYSTIPEIAKERIRRAGKTIMEEQKEKAEKEGDLFAEEHKKLDIGFKVFKLDSSNINSWDSNPENLETALQNSLFNIKNDRSEDDLLYEILIKYGIELTEKINRHSIAEKTVYEMGAGSLIVCLADNLTTDVAEGIGKLFKEVSPNGVDVNCRVVFKDSGFNGSDEVKTNTMLILKQHGIFNVTSV